MDSRNRASLEQLMSGGAKIEDQIAKCLTELAFMVVDPQRFEPFSERLQYWAQIDHPEDRRIGDLALLGLLVVVRELATRAGE